MIVLALTVVVVCPENILNANKLVYVVSEEMVNVKKERLAILLPIRLLTIALQEKIACAVTPVTNRVAIRLKNVAIEMENALKQEHVLTLIK